VRPNIWYKLFKLGIRGKLFKIIQSMYSQVRSRVKLLGETGDFFESFLWVRQGESLSPLIFSMYLNDLEEELFIKGSQGVDIGTMKLFLLMYADDYHICKFSRRTAIMS